MTGRPTRKAQPARQSRTLIVGIGSPHGDDQIGWEVARRLDGHLQAAARTLRSDEIARAPEVRAARTPSQLLDWLAGTDRLLLCDACHGGDPPGTVRHWEWPSSQIMQLRGSGTHDLDLPAVLRLADQLGQLPRQVQLWTIAASSVVPLAPLSEELRRAAQEVARSIGDLVGQDVTDARR